MLKLSVITLSSVLLLASCASVSPVQRQAVDCPVLADPPPEVMEPKTPDFLERMQNFLFESPPKPTTSQDN